MSLSVQWIGQNFPDLSQIIPLASGGFKQVYAADHPADGAVVLKLIVPVRDLEDINREILAVQAVASDRVPKILCHGSIDTVFGTCYWIREQRVVGGTLRELLAVEPLTPREVLRLGKDILQALVQAESANIVHRDVKPENIVRDANGQYWLLDFGIARHLTLDSRTASMLPFGKMTPGYAPPEQASNIKKAIDPRADLFAVGVTLYEAAIGVNPFTRGARDIHEILTRVNSVPMPSLNLQLIRAKSFADFVACMTQKRRDHRPPSVAAANVWLKEICVAEGL